LNYLETAQQDEQDEEKVKYLFMPYFTPSSEKVATELETKMIKYHNLLKNQSSIHKVDKSTPF
jgi:hypothetical protein